MASQRYPDSEHPFLRELPARAERFAAAREEYLLDYGYNTARAYWGDLDDLYLWCEAKRIDIFKLTEEQFRKYQTLLRRRGYSESTVRRRQTAWSGLRRSGESAQASSNRNTSQVATVSSSKPHRETTQEREH